MFRVLHLQEQEPCRKIKEPPPAFLEADWKDVRIDVFLLH